MLAKYFPKNQAQRALCSARQSAVVKAGCKRAIHRGKGIVRGQVRALACRRAWRVGELWNEEEAEFFRPYAEQLLR